ncbi:hypothetical protein M0P65_05180 [Candidatus Gracilibacteria bacterium]|nr:hypothetical protein [Candidatus Gracilibacteria bacterium]
MIIKRVMTDFDFPVSIYDDPIFSYQVDLYKLRYGINFAIGMMEQELIRLGSPENYFEFESSIRNKIIEKVRSKEGYRKFIETDLHKNESKKLKFEEIKSLYTPENDNKLFVSFDLVKANFQVFNHFDPEIFDNNTNWASYVLTHTKDSFYVGAAKRFRQVIFGNLSPNRQQSYQRYLISKLIGKAKEISFGELCFTSSDEFVLKIEDRTNLQEKLEEINAFSKSERLELRSSVFKLHQLKPFSFYVKEKETDSVIDKIDIKCVPDSFFSQAFKRAYELYAPYFPVISREIVKNDLAFYYEKRLAFFDKPLEFS